MQVGLLGCGVMGSAVARRIGDKASWMFYNRKVEEAKELSKELGGRVAKSMEELAEKCDIIILGVKPNNLDLASDGLSAIPDDKLVISLLGGVRQEELRSAFPNCHIARILPNIPLSYGEGVVGVYDDPHLGKDQRKIIGSLLDNMGLVLWMDENKLAAMSALAGSGPGFVYLLLEAFTEAGIAMGLTPSEALSMASQTFRGASIMAQKSQKHPAELKWQVTSPGGSTIAGLVEMETKKVRSGIMNGILKTWGAH